MLDGVWAADEQRLGSLREEILRLNKLVDELSMLSKYDSEALRLVHESFDLGELCRQITRNHQSIAQQSEIVLTCAAMPLIVTADRDKIGQVLINLLHNALKFTPAGGSITIENTAAGESAILRVRDSGCGIAPEALPYVFERFYRADTSRARETGGSGIGLSIALAIARAHGGTIHAESIVNKGSTFTLEFPLRSQA